MYLKSTKYSLSACVIIYSFIAKLFSCARSVASLAGSLTSRGEVGGWWVIEVHMK